MLLTGQSPFNRISQSAVYSLSFNHSNSQSIPPSVCLKSDFVIKLLLAASLENIFVFSDPVQSYLVRSFV